MQIRTFCLRFDPETSTFDDEPLRQFLEEHLVFDLDVHLLTTDVPMWAVFVRYRAEAEPHGSAPGRKFQVPAEARGLFEALRGWRNERARREGRPPYVLLTNRQLVGIALERPKSLEALGKVDGVGEARLNAFGREVLDLVSKYLEPAPASV